QFQCFAHGMNPPNRIFICRGAHGASAWLPDVVVSEALAELGDVVGLVFAVIEVDGGHIHRGAGDQILLPGDFVGGVRLALGAGAEAHAGDAVATLDGDAVGGEGPLVDEGTVALVHGGGRADALVAVERLVGVHQRLDMGGGFLVDPGG